MRSVSCIHIGLRWRQRTRSVKRLASLWWLMAMRERTGLLRMIRILSVYHTRFRIARSPRRPARLFRRSESGTVTTRLWQRKRWREFIPYCGTEYFEERGAPMADGPELHIRVCTDADIAELKRIHATSGFPY